MKLLFFVEQFMYDFCFKYSFLQFEEVCFTDKYITIFGGKQMASKLYIRTFWVCYNGYLFLHFYMNGYVYVYEYVYKQPVH